MRCLLSISLLLLVFNGNAQGVSFNHAIMKGNWLLFFDQQQDTIPPSMNDSVRLFKVSKRLKNKIERPIRFEKNGVVKTPSVCFGCCGTVGRLEAIWALKWRNAGEWEVSESGDDEFLHYYNFKLKLVESHRKEFTFVIVETYEGH